MIPIALILGCNDPIAVNVLSDFIEETTGHPLDLIQSGYDDGCQQRYGYSYGYGCDCGYHNGDGCGDAYGYIHTRDGYGNGQGYHNGDGNGDGYGDGNGKN